MGMSMGVGKKSLRGSNRFSRSLNSDINVTPFVDVMLVLLIIFMVTAPMMTVGVPVDLPKTKAGPLAEKSEPLTISITADGKIYIMETQTDLETMVAKLQAIISARPEGRIFVRGDQNINFGLIMQVMGALNSAGFEKIGLLAELPKLDSAKK
jgi:biopolymer transport protein TolR